MIGKLGKCLLNPAFPLDTPTGYGCRMIVDRAVYRDGTRVAEPDDFAELHEACRSGDAGLAGPLRAQQGRVRRSRPGVRPPRARGRGRGQGASAAEARALRRQPVSRPAAGPLRRRDGDGRVRGGRHLRRPAVRHHCPPRRRAGAGAGAAAGSRRAGPAAARPAGDPVRDRRLRRRRLRACRRRPGERHRRDRRRGLRRQSHCLATDL